MLAILVFLSPWLFFAALGPFQFGLWFQSEPVNVVLLTLTGLLSLRFAFDKQPAELLVLWKQPVFLALWGLTLCSTALAPFHDYPMRTIMGVPEIGQGAVSFLSLILLATAMIRVLAESRWRVPLLANSTLAALVMVGLHATQPEPYFLPSKWPDYLGFVGISIFIALIQLSPWQRRWHHLVYFLLGGLVVALSDSILAMVIYGIGLPIGMAMLYFIRQASYRRYLIYAGALIPLIYSLSCLFPESYQSLYNVTLGQGLSTQEAEHAFYNSSSGTRVLFGAILWKAMLAEPLYWLMGAGWGHYSDALFEHPFVANISNAVGGTYHTNWLYTSGTAFHSHNHYLEALYATGLAGLLCFAAISFLGIRQLSAAKLVTAGPAWIGLMLLLGAWFILPIALPFLALVLAVLIGSEKTEIAQSRKAVTLLKVLFPLLSVGLFTLATLHYQAAHAGRAFMDSIQQGPPQANTQLKEEPASGHYRLWWVALNLYDYLRKKQQNPHISVTEIDQDVTWFVDILNQLDEALPEGTHHPRLRSLRAMMMNDLILLYSDPAWDPLRAKALPNWHKVLWSVIEAHPTRGDMAVPYFRYYLTLARQTNQPEFKTHYRQNILQLSETVLQNNPDDPTALWFSGSVFALEDETRELGKERIRQALALGAANRFPLYDAKD